MSFLNLGKKEETSFHELHQTFASHEEAAKNSLFQKHPHVGGILAKHNIDLKNVRKHKGKIAVAAALGALLAFPHLLGNPTHHEQKRDQIELGAQQTISQPVNNSLPNHFSQASNTPSGNPNGSSPTQVSSNPLDGNSSQSQGHQYGRSYMAPPKEHGFHDLGLHKGAENGQGNAQAPGPHPEELNVHHQDKGDV